MSVLPIKLDPSDPLRIETDLDQGPSVRADGAPGDARLCRDSHELSFYFNEVGANNNFAALPFHQLDWMRYLARKKALESEV